MSKWYCRITTEEQGPLTFQQLVGMVLDNTLQEDDLVRADYEKHWRRADEVIGLFYMARRAVHFRQRVTDGEVGGSVIPLSEARTSQPLDSARDDADSSHDVLLIKSEWNETVAAALAQLDDHVAPRLTVDGRTGICSYGVLFRFIIGPISWVLRIVGHSALWIFRLSVKRLVHIGMLTQSLIETNEEPISNSLTEAEPESRHSKSRLTDSQFFASTQATWRDLRAESTTLSLADLEVAAYSVNEVQIDVPSADIEIIQQADLSEIGNLESQSKKATFIENVPAEEWNEVVADALAQHDARHRQFQKSQQPKRGISYWCGLILLRTVWLVVAALRELSSLLWVPFAALGSSANAQLDAGFEAAQQGWWGRLIRSVESFCNVIGLGEDGARWAFTLLWTALAANGMALGLMLWSEQEEMRFPVRKGMSQTKYFPVVGACQPASYWVLYGHAVILAGAATFGLSNAIANRAA